MNYLGMETHNFCTDAERLFAKNVFVILDSLQGLVSVCPCYSGNYDCFQPIMLQELIVVGVYGCTVRLELLISPFCLTFIKSPSSDHICSKCTLKKVCGMSAAHSA